MSSRHTVDKIRCADVERRRLLGGGAAAAGGLFLSGLGPRSARSANPARQRRFVFAYFEGGWDQLLSLDPRDPAKTNPAQHQIDPGYDQLGFSAGDALARRGQLTFGPAVPASMLDLAAETSIVKGIVMDTAAHEVGRRYFITGRFPRGISAVGSSTGSEIIAQVGENALIPHLSAGVEAYATGLPPYASPLGINSFADILLALTPLGRIDPVVRAAIEGYQDTGPGCAGVQLDRDGAVTRLSQSIQRSRSYVRAKVDKVFDITRKDPAMAALRNLYDVGEDLTAPEVLALMAGQAVKEGVSQCVSVRVAEGLDSHSNWAQDQLPRQQRGWRVLSALLRDLKSTPSKANPGKSVLDETTIIAWSEFGRTPLFNNIKGRDHFLGNSCLLAGAGIKRGIAVGESAAVGMMPIDTDLQTGRGVATPSEQQRASGNVVTLTPKHVLATLLASAGLDASHLRAPPIRALLP
jgi:uncharacterized protein (DUF1501 family)